MQRDILYLSWHDFEEAVDYLADKAKYFPVDSIYGRPRGGLPLAVALSHRLNLPLTTEPTKRSLWVDDIVDSGKTIEEDYGKCCAYVAWCSKTSPAFLFRYLSLSPSVWVVFPWEDKNKAVQDRQQYIASRQQPLFAEGG